MYHKKGYILFLSSLFIAIFFSLTSCKPVEPVTSTDGSIEKKASETVGNSDTPSAEKTDDWEAENRTLVTNLAANASTSDPFGHSNVVDRGWLLNAYEPLFCYNGITGEREPRVGKKVDISADGLTYTVEIFDAIYFHNDKHVTAEDVKRSFEYAQTSAFNKQFSGIVDHVEVVSEYVVDIFLKEPSAPFLSNSDQIFILDMDEVEAQGEDFGTIANKAGTGAYYIEKYDPSVEILMKRHEKFHREITGRPIPELMFKVMTDPSAVNIAFESGDLDFIPVQPSNFENIKGSGLYNTYLGQTTQLVFFVMNSHNDDMLSNKLIRQAVAYGSDYEGMRDAAMDGMGDITGKLAHPDFTIAAPKVTDGIIYTYDPEKAKSLLKEAGYEDGVDIGSILCTAGSNREKMAQVMQASLGEVGITVGIDPREQVTGIADMRDGKYQIGIMGYYLMMDYDYLTGNWDVGDNDKGSMVKLKNSLDYDWEKVFALIYEGRLQTDEEERRKIYIEMEEIFMDAAVQIPILHTALPYAWDKNLYINTEKPYTYHYTQFWDAYWE